MSSFSTFDIAGSGVGFSKYWMDVVAHNVANVSTVTGAGQEPFRARLVVAREVGGQGGVQVGDVVSDERQAGRQYDPTSPQADAEGYVTTPVVDLATQMSDLMLANRTYQLNLKTIESAREAYQASLRIGQR